MSHRSLGPVILTLIGIDDLKSILHCHYYVDEGFRTVILASKTQIAY